MLTRGRIEVWALSALFLGSSAAWCQNPPTPPKFGGFSKELEEQPTVNPQAFRAVKTPPPKLPETPDELLKYMEKTLVVVADERKEAEVEKAFREAFANILAAADKLTKISSKPEHVNEANQYRASILYQGARRDVKGYASDLEQLSRDLSTDLTKPGASSDDRRVEVAALAFYLSIRAKHDTEFGGLHFAALAGVKKYIEKFPRDEAAIDLIEAVANEAESGARPDEARQAYDLLKEKFPLNAVYRDKMDGVKRRLSLLGTPPMPLDVSGKAMGDGRPVSLASPAYADKIVVVYFWDVASDPGGKHAAELKELKKQYGSKFDVIGIPLDADKAVVDDFIQKNQVGWTNLETPASLNGGTAAGFDHPIAQKCGVVKTPTMFLVNKDGKVASTHVRFEYLDARVGDLLGSAPASITTRPNANLLPNK